METERRSLKRARKVFEKYTLNLYFAGRSPRTTLAIANLKKFCNERLPRRCKLKLIDLYKNPALAKDEQIVAAPTLVKKFPLPERRVVGDLSDMDLVFSGLELK